MREHLFLKMDINQVLNFESHGLIDSPYLETYYRSVGNYPREVQTLKLMENVFNKALFRDSDDVTVNSHGTLSYDYIRINCHFVVNYFKNGNDTAAEEILCFTHGITGTGQNSAVRDFETQVIRHCRHYLENKCLGTREFVYLCTAFGTRLKIWKLFRGDHESTGMWGGYGLTVDDSSYLDVGDEEGSRQIKQAFDKIISRSSNPGNEQVTDVYPGKPVQYLSGVK